MGMYGSEIRRLNKMVEEKVPAPDLSGYNLVESIDDEFSNFYNNNKKFVQVIICDNYENVERWFLVEGFEAYHEIKEMFKEYDAKRKQWREIIAVDNLEYEFQVDDYLALSRLSNFGKSVRLHKRYKPEEQAREQDQAIEHEKSMQEDDEYRKHHEWMNEKERPFGGAFESWEDYYRYRGIE